MALAIDGLGARDSALPRDLDPTWLIPPDGCYELGGGFQFRHDAGRGSSMALQGTDVSFAPGVATITETPLSDLAPTDQARLIAAREANGWTTEEIVLLTALTSPNAVTRARMRGDFGPQITDGELYERMQVTRSRLLASARCTPT